MPSLIGSTVATNYLRTVSTENYTESAGVRTYTGPFTQFGTRQLSFVKVTATTDGSTAVNFSTTYTNADSNFSRAVRAVQGFAEIYFVTTPDSTGFALAIADDTRNGAESSSNTQAATYGALEKAINEALAGSSTIGSRTCTVAALTATGVSIA